MTALKSIRKAQRPQGRAERLEEVPLSPHVIRGIASSRVKPSELLKLQLIMKKKVSFYFLVSGTGADK